MRIKAVCWLMLFILIWAGVGCESSDDVNSGEGGATPVHNGDTLNIANDSEAAEPEESAAMWVKDGYEDDIRIISFDPPRGVHFSGDRITPSVTFQYTGTGEKELWVGCSFQIPTGQWYDLPAVPLLLSSGDITTQEMPWEIPGELVSGKYKFLLV